MRADATAVKGIVLTGNHSMLYPTKLRGQSQASINLTGLGCVRLEAALWELGLNFSEAAADCGKTDFSVE